MRASFLNLSLLIFLILLMHTFLTGVVLGLAWFFLVFFVVISVAYMDALLLFFMGSREVKRLDTPRLHEVALQQAYKLGLPEPRIYIYNGEMERAFVFQHLSRVSLVIEKRLIDSCDASELTAICFFLLLQAKIGLAVQRTKAMFLVGTMNSAFYKAADFLGKLLPIKVVKISIKWLFHFLINPWTELVFNFCVGRKYFKKLEQNLEKYPQERHQLRLIVSKIKSEQEALSFTSRKLFEYSSFTKGSQLQNIIALEFLPHEWDLIFNQKSESSV